MSGKGEHVCPPTDKQKSLEPVYLVGRAVPCQPGFGLRRFIGALLWKQSEQKATKETEREETVRGVSLGCLRLLL
jgi:hypothetical protein